VFREFANYQRPPSEEKTIHLDSKPARGVFREFANMGQRKVIIAYHARLTDHDGEKPARRNSDVSASDWSGLKYRGSAATVLRPASRPLIN